MKKNPQIFWTIVLLVFAIVAWLFISFGNNKNGAKITDIFNVSDEGKEILPLGEGQEVTDVSFGSKNYKHTILGFNFEYPKEYYISSFGNFFDSNGETILLQNKENTKGLQILITPFDENIDLTINKIKKDLPSLSINEEKEMKIGGESSKIQVVVFKSSNNLSVGKSNEAWFVYNMNLYQISGSEESKELFDMIIKTWEQIQ